MLDHELMTGADPVHFLMFNVDARDGVSRAVLTLANHLSLTREVEVVSLYRRPEGPAYPISPAIRVTYLFDRQPGRRELDGGTAHRWPLLRHPVKRLLARGRSRLTGGRGFPNYSLLTDRALARAIGSIRSGVLVSTRPALHAAAARLAGPGVVTIGQDHLNFVSRSTEPGSLDLIRDACEHGLDAFVTLTRSDAADYRRFLAGTRTCIATIPNALPWPVSPPRDAAPSRVVVAAGRLVPRKGMGRLVRAFEPVARRHPDWELRIYGSGRLEDRLRGLVEERGLTRQVHLLGHTDDLPGAFDEAAVFASASAAEGFPMVMLEALSKGLPLVGFDCPRGPADIIDHGRNGLLVPNQDVPALSAALELVVGDDERRRALGARAREDAGRYAVERVARSWDDLFAELDATADAAPAVVAAHR